MFQIKKKNNKKIKKKTKKLKNMHLKNQIKLH